jgi:hypothetical protein
MLPGMWNKGTQLCGKGKVVCVHETRACLASRGRPVAPLVLNLGSSYISVVSFTLRWLYPGIHCIGGCVDPRVGLGVLQQGRLSYSYKKSNHDSSAV